PFTETKRGIVISLAAEVLFGTGEADLKSGAKGALNRVINIMKRYPDRKISIEGHTDNIPISTARFPNNQVLSEERAKSILKHLAGKTQISPDRFSTKGLGETRSIAPNTTEEGRKKNRRVEIILLK
ncbi:unnamed protein product, partial [marine sediment metagenome]